MVLLCHHISNFYPRSPCGERPFCSIPTTQRRLISIHALLAESDGAGFAHGEKTDAISIHALLAESDGRQNLFIKGHKNFYPRSPCGERRLLPHTHPPLSSISIHALLAESDRHDAQQRRSQRYFYPRSPCGERHAGVHVQRLAAHISIHALLAESDRPLMGRLILYTRFLSTLSLRRATFPAGGSGQDILFLSTLSLRRATITKKHAASALILFLSTLSLRRATSCTPRCTRRR